MKSNNKRLLLIFFVLLYFQFNAVSQEIANTDTVLLSAAREIISSATTCALITLDEEGRPSVRAMETLPLDDDFIVWFGTNPKSRKVIEIKNNSRVTLYYLDNDASGYVTIHGTAKIIADKKAKEAHWKKEWTAFYPNKNDGYVLIKITPISMEVISNSRGISGDTITWKVPKVIF